MGVLDALIYCDDCVLHGDGGGNFQNRACSFGGDIKYVFCCKLRLFSSCLVSALIVALSLF